MAIINSSNSNFINLNGFKGSGEVSRYVNDVTGFLLGIEPRDGSYVVNDRRTGKPVERPNSWTAYVQTPEGIMYWSWPTYIDQVTGQVLPWSRFDSSIDLGVVVAERQLIHLSKDEKGFCHLELVQTKATLNPVGQHMAAPMATPTVMPWEN